MKPLVAFALAAIALAGCKEDNVGKSADILPIAMTDETLGHYCQMLLTEHPGPKAQVHLAGNSDPLFFAQVRDAIAYHRMPEQSQAIKAIFVSDMGAAESWASPGRENWIALRAAHFVIGSDAAGGMGAPELVPFAEADAAEAFAAEHGGRVVQLAQIADADVLAPVDAGDDHDFTRRLHGLNRQGHL